MRNLRGVFCIAFIFVLSGHLLAAATPGRTCNDLLVVTPIEYYDKGPLRFAMEKGELDTHIRYWFDHYSPKKLRETLMPILHYPEARKALFDWVQRDFQRISEETVAKLAKQKGHSSVAFVGAGFHTTVAASTMMAELGAVWGKARENVVVFERRSKVGGNFIDKHFFLNSPERVGQTSTNHIPNGLFQISDFAPGEGQVYAHDMGSVIALNLRVTGVSVVLEHDLVKAQVQEGHSNHPNKSMKLELLNHSNRTGFQHTTDLLAMVPGMGDPKLDYFDIATQLYLLSLLDQKTPAKLNDFLETGIITSQQFLQAIYQENYKVVLEALKGKRVIIIGREHSAFVSAEILLGRMIYAKRGDFSPYDPTERTGGDFDRPTMPRTVKSISMIGIRSKTTQEFYRELRPGGGIEHNPLFPMRYYRFSLSTLLPELDVVSSPGVSISHVSSSVHKVQTESGESRKGDLIILATGNTNQILENIGMNDTNLFNIIANLKGTPTQIGQQIFDKAGNPLPALLFGAGMNIDVDPERLGRTLTGSPHSFNYLSPGSAAMGKLISNTLQNGVKSTQLDLTQNILTMNVPLPLPALEEKFIEIRQITDALIASESDLTPLDLDDADSPLHFFQTRKFLYNYIIELFREKSTTSRMRIRILQMIDGTYPYSRDDRGRIFAQLYVYYSSRFGNPKEQKLWSQEKQSYPHIVTAKESALLLKHKKFWERVESEVF